MEVHDAVAEPALVQQVKLDPTPSDRDRLPAPTTNGALAPSGTLVDNSGDSKGHWIGPLSRVIKARPLPPFVDQKMVSFTVKPNKQDLELLKQLIGAGKVTPVIDRRYSLSEVPEALRRLEEDARAGRPSSRCEAGTTRRSRP